MSKFFAASPPLPPPPPIEQQMFDNDARGAPAEEDWIPKNYVEKG